MWPSVLDRQLSKYKTMLGEGAMAALTSTLATGTPLPGIALGALKGYTRPYQSAGKPC